MRHPHEGAALAASLYSKKPLINAGDGGHFHPTQTLADLFTISKEKNILSGLTIGLCGDLKHGRTVHSLLRALSLFGKNTYYLISTLTLKLPLYITELLKETGSTLYEVRTIDECIDKLDVLYMTRIQKERFASEEQYKEQSGQYILSKEKLKRARNDLSVLHPLPRVDEIMEEVDFDPRALYFKQAENGMFMRMALIIKMLDNNKERELDINKYLDVSKTTVCPNPACITRTEKYLPTLTYKLPSPRPGLACSYCDYRIN
jgi:aspartate carbamoyltransferase catalytic subunit